MIYSTNECILFNNMTGKEFKIQRVTMDFTQAELGEKLNISANTVSRYETEDLKIPKVVELAMKQLASEHTEERPKTGRPPKVKND